MSNKPVFVSDSLVSGAAAVNGRPVYIGGNLFTVQTDDPGTTTLLAIDVSTDKANWIEDTGTLGDAITQVTTRPLWARGRVAIDAGAPNDCHFGFTIFKDVG
jgi:hypothetical protein